jgi:hypothetical protein
MQASLLSSSWGHCPYCNGIAVVDAQTSLQFRHLCYCHNISAALAAMALLLSSGWCCHPHHDGVIAIINAQASLPSSRWHHHPCCAGAIANITWALLPSLHWRCCLHCTYLFALTLHEHRHRHCTGVVAPIDLACLHRCAGVIALVTLVLLPSMSWHYCPCCAGLYALVALALCSWLPGVFTLVELACTKPQTTW